MLCAGTRIEAHDEVVAVVVCGLQLLCWLGEEEGAPVGDATDDALLVEDNFACGFGDSTGYRVSGVLEVVEWWEGEITLLLQRGGQAVPAPVSIPLCRQCDTQHTTPIISYSILPRLRGVVADVVPSVAKTVRKRPTFPQPRRSSTPMSLARVITSPTPTNLKLSHSHIQSLQNGCPDFNRTRCAPIHLCRREETITFRVPEVAAGDFQATASLGICRSYAHLKLWKAIELQAGSLTGRSEGEEVHRGP